MRIGQLIVSKGFYGAEKVVHDLSLSLSKQGFEVSAIVNQDLKNPFIELNRFGIETHVLPITYRFGRKNRFPRLLSFLHSSVLLRKIVHQDSLDLLHIHLPGAFYLVKMANLGKLPFICTFHGDEALNTIGNPGSLDGCLMWSLLGRASALTAVSDYITRYLRAFVLHSNIVTVYNGANVDEIEALSKESSDPLYASLARADRTKYIVLVGRINRTKGHEQVVKALPAIKRQVPQAKVLFIGGGPYLKEIQNLARQLKLDNDVIFAGYVPNRRVYPYIAMASVVVTHISCDRLHVFDRGMTQLEAIALRRPLVTRQDSEYRRIFGDTLFYVNPGDIDDIADRIVVALTDERSSTVMAEQGKRILRANLTWDKIAQRYAELYHATLHTSESAHVSAQ